MNMIAATGADGAIGINGDLIWHIPEDLRHFKRTTLGHPVIMGRKTWESLPRRPLPGRRNIVVTRNRDFHADGAEIAHSPIEASEMTRGEEPFVIGGEQLYNAFLPLATRFVLTEIDAVSPEADARIPYPLNPEEWALEEATEKFTTPDGLSYRFASYRRIAPAK